MSLNQTARFMPCVVIPCYNHGNLIGYVMERLATFNLPCIIVDDGSDQATKEVLAGLVRHYHWLELITLAENSGKGAAVMAGLKEATQQGYSHVLQIDADNQHDLADIPALLDKANLYPEAIISGQPVYDESVPKARLYARYITHFWVWIETLSLAIKDSMCGFRVYPLAPVMALLTKCNLGKRMDFDTEVMVRLYWLGIDCHFVATKVVYPYEGISHFDLLKDNLRISWMHTKLCLGMLPRIPRLLKRHFGSPQHWSQINERKGLWGMRFLVNCYRFLGRRVCSLLLYPIVGYFWLTGSQQRHASANYLKQLKWYAAKQSISLPANLTTYRHFIHFAHAAVDKMAAWFGKIPPEQFDFPNKSHCLAQLQSTRGGFLLVSHLGDIEVCRALAEMAYHTTVNAFVFTKHAVRFNQMMQEINPHSAINLIEVDEVGMDTTILLEQKLQAGEWVAIVGDRTAVSQYHRDPQQSVVWADFLGKAAPFPKGPFILALLLKHPVYLMFCLKPTNKFEIYFEPFAMPTDCKKMNRHLLVEELATRYARELTKYCLKSPLDWFNFYDFWQENSSLATSPEDQ